jgi:hypothetical protein
VPTKRPVGVVVDMHHYVDGHVQKFAYNLIREVAALAVL